MKNYISINSKQIPLTDDQVKEIQKSFGIPGIKLSDIPVGETFKIGDDEWIVLEHSGDTTAVILNGFAVDELRFGTSNNYDGSIVDAALARVAGKLASLIGKENLILHTVDLTSNDGLKDYGKIKRHVSAMTADLYRRYVDILDKYKPKKYWWLATPWSTARHESTRLVLCVAPSGLIGGGNFGDAFGVRPFCILNNSIFVSR